MKHFGCLRYLRFKACLSRYNSMEASMETTMEQMADQGVAPTAEHFVERVRRRTRKKFTVEDRSGS